MLKPNSYKMGALASNLFFSGQKNEGITLDNSKTYLFWQFINRIIVKANWSNRGPRLKMKGDFNNNMYEPR